MDQRNMNRYNRGLIIIAQRKHGKYRAIRFLSFLTEKKKFLKFDENSNGQSNGIRILFLEVTEKISQLENEINLSLTI